jgi:hypothetical protein
VEWQLSSRERVSSSVPEHRHRGAGSLEKYERHAVQALMDEEMEPQGKGNQRK